MNRLFLVVTALAALPGCIDQAPTTDSVDQASTEPPPGSPPYSTIWAVHWDPKVNKFNTAFWDPGTNPAVPNWSSYMTYVNNEGNPAVRCPVPVAACPGAREATRMIWLISNERVYRTWEVDVSDMPLFNSMLGDAIANVKSFAGGSAVNWAIVTGTDTHPPKFGGPPHAWPLSTVNKMYSAVQSFRGLGLGTIQDSQLQTPPTGTVTGPS